MKLFLVGRANLNDPDPSIVAAESGPQAVRQTYGHLVSMSPEFRGWYVEVIPVKLTKGTEDEGIIAHYEIH